MKSEKTRSIPMTVCYWRSGLSLWIIRAARRIDGFVHRLGKPEPSTTLSFLNTSIAFDGLKAVQSLIDDVFVQTPEFASKFIYQFLSFWSCRTDSPWVWDGCQGTSFHLGLGKIDFSQIITLHAPLPAQFGDVDEGSIK